MAITRPIVGTTGGVKSYGGRRQSDESEVASGLPASIQLKRRGGGLDSGGTPTAVARTSWTILIPPAAAANGLIRKSDVITDDLGIRYTVVGPYWNSLGYNLLCEEETP